MADEELQALEALLTSLVQVTTKLRNVIKDKETREALTRPVAGQDERFASMKLDDLDIGARLDYVFEDRHLKTVADLVAMFPTINALYRVRGIGKKTLAEFQRALAAKFGVRLPEEDD